MNTPVRKLCEGSGRDNYDFRSMELKVDEDTQKVTLSIGYNSKCTGCFYLEECVGKKTEEILLRNPGITFEGGISEESVMHS